MSVPIYVLLVAAVAIVSYLWGSVNFAVIISKAAKRDVRNSGSGNPGTMNMFRTFGVKLGLLTLCLDVIKGALPALLGWFLLGDENFAFGADKIGALIAGLAVVLGHIFPVAFKLHGGKGVACAIGVAIVVNPLVAGIAFALALVFFLTVKIGSLASFIATGIPLVFDGVKYLYTGDAAAGVLALVIFAVVLAAHRANIARILTGNENKIYLFGDKKTATRYASDDAEVVVVRDVEEVPREPEPETEESAEETSDELGER